MSSPNDNNDHGKQDTINKVHLPRHLKDRSYILDTHKELVCNGASTPGSHCQKKKKKKKL
ncbi:hypothetical protein I7I48_09069 [Histoplasma ohiense]|nr:hypothetical protein I7I48_09069 [Histoplasma ohiense (nom. inval.)]